MLIIVSDLHLTDGTCGRSISSTAFKLFFDRLRELTLNASWRADGYYNPVQEVDLLLLGDILDLQHSTLWLEKEDGTPNPVRPWTDFHAPEFAATVRAITDGILKNRMKVAPPGQGLESRTLVEVVSRGRTTTMVSAYPRTGRQHQIRVHLDAIGHPIVGDKLYGVDEALFLAFCDSGLDAEMHKTLGMPRHALHAHEVRLAHPRSGEPLEVRSALPEDIRQHFLDDQGAMQ